VVVVLLDVLDEGVVLEELLVSPEPLEELGVLELLVEPEPEAPIELVLPELLGEVLLLPMALVLPGLVELLPDGEVVDELVEPVVVPVSVRFVQAPSEKAATIARAAHVVLDAFIRKLLEGVVRKSQRAVAP
jgi:hypothetical protein